MAISKENTTKKKFWLHGITFPNAKKIARYEFGGQLFKVTQNDQDRTFDIYVMGDVDQKKKNKLEDAFPGFKVLEVTIKKETKRPS